MASVHEAIHTATPASHNYPMIPEQQITAERISDLGIGIAFLQPPKLSVHTLKEAILDILSDSAKYIRQLKVLAAAGSSLSAQVKARLAIDAFLRNRLAAADTVVSLFVRSAEATPDAMAVRSPDVQLSYRDLHEQSSRLARTLRDSGLRGNEPVAIIMAPCTDIIVAILGVLKSGGCYIPIDPDYPAERIGYILKDSAARIIVSNRPSIQRCRLSEAFAIVWVDEPEKMPVVDFTPLAEAAEAAYIIYTSGSTGKPKGVIVEHRQILRHVLDVFARLELIDCRNYAIWGTFSADAGLTAVFAALCFGKALHILDIKAHTPFKALIRYVEAYPIDCYKITPSLLNTLLQNQEARAILPAKRLILGGEACPRMLAEQVYGLLLPAGCKLYNHYGPTETTVGVTTYAFPASIQDWPPATIPLGQPLPCVSAHLLNTGWNTAGRR